MSSTGRNSLALPFNFDYSQSIPILDVAMSFGLGVFARTEVALAPGGKSVLMLYHGKPNTSQGRRAAYDLASGM